MIWYDFGPIRTSGSIVSTLTLHSLTGTLKGPGPFEPDYRTRMSFQGVWLHHLHRGQASAPSRWESSQDVVRQPSIFSLPRSCEGDQPDWVGEQARDHRHRSDKPSI